MENRFMFRATVLVYYNHQVESEEEYEDKECSLLIYDVDIFEDSLDIGVTRDKLYNAIDALDLSLEEKEDVKNSLDIEDARDPDHDDYFTFPTDLIEQSPGATDYNSKLIYEGDFIELADGRIYEVVWDEESYGFVLKEKETSVYLCPESICDIAGQWNCTIIGNIHEGIKEK